MLFNGRLSPIGISLSNFDTSCPPSNSTPSEEEKYVPIHKRESFVGNEGSSVSSSPATTVKSFESDDFDGCDGKLEIYHHLLEIRLTRGPC